MWGKPRKRAKQTDYGKYNELTGNRRQIRIYKDIPTLMRNTWGETRNRWAWVGQRDRTTKLTQWINTRKTHRILVCVPRFSFIVSLCFGFVFTCLFISCVSVSQCVLLFLFSLSQPFCASLQSVNHSHLLPFLITAAVSSVWFCTGFLLYITRDSPISVTKKCAKVEAKIRRSAFFSKAGKGLLSSFLLI